jgi:hypothetical protein
MADAVEFDLDGVMRKLDRINQYQVPFAASLALNRIAVNMRDQLRETMKTTFQNPVPFTLNSLYIKASNKSNLEIEVGLKEFAPKGNPASKYLLPQIKGGPAYDTRFQKSLQYKQLLAPGMYAVPTQSDYIRRNQYGNVMPSQYTEILYSLRAFRDQSAFSFTRHANKKKNTTEYFAVTTTRRTKTGYLYPGIYRQNVDPGYEQDRAIFWFQRRIPKGKGNFPLTRIGREFASNNWDKQFGQALAQAIRTAK